MMSGGNRAPALVTATLVLGLLWSGSAAAQTTTGTAATEGAGVQIPEGESRPPKPPTAAEVDAPQNQDQEIEARARETAYYEQGADSFAADMRALIREKYDEQKDLLAAQYDRSIMELEEQERTRRLEAIARFEEFLKKYPNDPAYSPDAMFRLAELYFEKSSDDYLTTSKGYEAELAAYERGERETEPPPPEPSYEKTIGIHQDLLSRFPDYRLADAARYLLGYCYGEQGQTENALAAYQDLVTKHPDSKFLAEVWTRIGEIYFDGSDVATLEKAIDAYSKVRAFPDSPYFDKALYKIAWTYYRLDRFDPAVKSFIELVDYADAQKKATGVTGSELRAEAIQYIALSLADEEWGGLEKARAVLEPIESKDYTGELWKRYGEILFDQTRYDLAVEVLAYTIKKYPNAPYNPEAQEKIVRAHEQLRDFDKAAKAREVLVADYSKGSPWYEANKNDREAITLAESLTERSLYSAAIFRHQQAQAYKQANKMTEAKESYVAAATAYQQYLARFPEGKNSYDFEFFLAECLFYSGDYLKAAAQYDKVRDSKVDNKHLEAAALSAVITYEKEVERAVASKQVEDYPLLTAQQRKGKTMEPKAIAPIRNQLIEASDRYTKLLPNTERTGAVQYRAGEIFYRHDQMDEARRRFEQIVAERPGTDVARYASNLIIESYLAVEDWAAVEKWSQRLIEVAQKNSDPKSDPKAKDDFIGGLKTFRVGAQFKQAEKYDAEGKYEEAANTYVRLVDDNPTHEFADKALYNAAVAYEKVNRFDTASKMYQRIYDQYPKSEIAPKALFRVGINAEKGFDFPQAIQSYTQLVERYPDSENRADALYNVAVVLENMQQYQQAAEAFKRYAQTFPKRDDAGDVFFRSALVYEKMKAWPEMVSTLEDFINRYKNAGSEKERIIHAYKKIGDANAARNSDQKALAAYKTCVAEFNRRSLSIQGEAGGHAAVCAFELAENEFERYDAMQITGTGKAQVKALTEKAKAQQAVEKTYGGIFKYKRVEQTLASSYRIGHSYERFADALFSAPIPKEFQSNEELANEYKAQLEDKAAVLERKAEAAYRKAFEEARRTRVTNEWTQRILEGLNKYAPTEFPIQKAGKPRMQSNNISGHPLDTLEPAPAAGPKPDAQAPSPGGARTAQGGE